jgi:hypothetical protein
LSDIKTHSAGIDKVKGVPAAPMPIDSLELAAANQAGYR